MDRRATFADRSDMLEAVQWKRTVVYECRMSNKEGSKTVSYAPAELCSVEPMILHDGFQGELLSPATSRQVMRVMSRTISRPATRAIGPQASWPSSNTTHWPSRLYPVGVASAIVSFPRLSIT